MYQLLSPDPKISPVRSFGSGGFRLFGGGSSGAGGGGNGTGIYAAWGARKIYASYSGPLLRLRRSTDSVEQDFSAGASGWVDNAAVTSWLGGGTGFVAIAYDHSGRSRNYVQPTASAQPSFVVNGAKSYIAFASGKTLLPSSDMLDMGRYVPGLTFGLRMRQPANPTAIRWPFVITTGVSDTAPRLGLRITTQSNMSAYIATNWDEGTTANTTITATGTGFISVVVQGDFLGYRVRCNVNGTATTAARTESARTRNSASLGAKLNGTSVDTGGIWHMEALVIYQRALSDADADTLKAGMDDMDTFTIPSVGAVQTYDNIPSTVFPFGDSTTMNSALTPVQRWCAKCGLEWTNYRMFVNRGMDGQTSPQILARLLTAISSGEIGPNEVVIFWVGRNNPDYAQIMADCASAWEAMPATKRILFIGFYNPFTENGPPSEHANYTTCIAVNNALAALYPDNYLDLRTPWVHSGNESDPFYAADLSRDTIPRAQTYDNLHANDYGTTTQTGIIVPALKANPLFNP